MTDKYKWVGSKTDGPKVIKIDGELRSSGYVLPQGALPQLVLDHYMGIGEMERIVENTQEPSRLVETPVVEPPPKPKTKKAPKRRKRK